MIGLLGGTAVAFAFGKTHHVDVFGSGIVNLPTLMPFGTPVFDLVARSRTCCGRCPKRWSVERRSSSSR